MTIEEIRLELEQWIQEDGSLQSHTGEYVSWYRGNRICLDGDFTPRQLMAIAMWMQAHGCE